MSVRGAHTLGEILSQPTAWRAALEEATANEKHIKDLLKEKEITEDDEHRAEDEVQKLTDKWVAAIDEVVKEKEVELMVI